MENDEHPSRRQLWRKVKPFVRLTIALVVAVGLVIAAQKAIAEWNRQAEIANDRVEEIDRRLIDASGEDRSRLEAERDQAEQQIPDLRRLDWTLVSLAFLLYSLGLVPGGLVLASATKTLGHPVRLWPALAAQTVGHLGKYVPGKAMVVVMRAARLSDCGVPLVAGSIAVFMETLMMMAVGAALAGVLICFLPVPAWIAVTALFGGLCASIPTTPAILNRVLSKLATVSPSAENRGQGWRFFRDAWLWQLTAWGLIGGSFACLVASMPGAPSLTSNPLVAVASVAAIALAMVVGFASLLPGGAGIRELTLAIVLAPVVGQSQALLAAIAARLLFIVVELAAAGLVIALRPKPQSSSDSIASSVTP